MKKLVLFIHGLGGAADSTWKEFPELVRSDPDLAGYDVESLEYSTGVVGRKPSLAECATILKTEIENRYPSHSEIAIIAHSQGGLIARYYIAERLNSGQPLRVDRLLTFATPHQGSGWANLMKRVPFASQQSADLDPNSQFLLALGVAWGQAKADRRVLTKYVGASDDAIVGPVSAMGAWNPNYDVVAGAGHISVVKPDAGDAMSFLVAKNFLLHEPLLPGGVEADYRPPLLRFYLLNAEETTRFVYSARVLPLIGRDAEIGTLTDFLDHADMPFGWMVMHGSAGVGKSRLALEICLAVGKEWHAGFLPQGGQEPDWGRWQPLLPTLIVIDSAARDTEHNRMLLQALAGRGTTDGTLGLEAPVRVLLLERTVEGGWLDKILGDEVTKAQLTAVRAPDLPLTTVSDPWPIFEFVLGRKNAPLPDRAETLAAFGEIDPERRPLFAYFMADAMARGDDVRHFDAQRLLDQVVNHSRNAYWAPAGVTAKDERLMAVATMAGGLPVSAFDDIREKLLPIWDVDRHPAMFLAMTGQESGEHIAPLQPDIVGEHFALACLGQGNLSNDDRARLCALAWRLAPRNMGQFAGRSHRDLPGHAMLRWIRKLPPFEGEPQSFWAMAAAGMLLELRSRDPVEARALLDDVRRVAEKHDDASLWEHWTFAAATSFGGDLSSLLHNSVIGGGAPSRAEPPAKRIFFYANPLVSRDRAAARALLDDMRGVAAKRDETELWHAWTYAAFAVIDDLFSHDPIAAWTLLRDVSSVMASAQDDALGLWNAMVRNIVNAASPVWLNKIHEVAEARDEASLWELWAHFALGLTDGPIARDADRARELLDDMRDVATRRNDATLWVQWARASAVVTNTLRTIDLDAAWAVLADMRDVAVKRNENALWAMWAMPAANLTSAVASRDPTAARALVDGLHGVATLFDKDVTWELWAKAARSVMNDMGSRDPDAARGLLDAMHDVAKARDQASLWELWTMAAGKLMIDIRSSDPQQARSLLDSMRDTAAHRDNALLWVMWAKAAVILIAEVRSRDPATAKALSALVRALPPDILQQAEISASEIED
jgi:hypothetical protein